LKEIIPDAVLSYSDDAAVFGLNAFSDGLNVLLPQARPVRVSRGAAAAAGRRPRRAARRPRRRRP
ncbi:hypothetical protein ACFWA1_26850, partial [Streptomyces sp. NPDC060005]